MGRTKQRAKEREKQRRRQRQRNIFIGIVVAAVVLAGFAAIALIPPSVDISDDLLTRYENLPVSRTDRGFYVLGNPEAPAKLVEYSSFDCPSCRDFHSNVTVNLIERIAAGEASFTYVPVYGTGSIPSGDRAARAALCSGEQGRFWEMHDLLFDWQGRYVASAFQMSRITAGAEALGLDMAAFNTCMGDESQDETMDNALAAFRQSGANGTPALEINNELVSATLAVANASIDTIMEDAEPVPVVVEDEAAVVDEEATEEETAEVTEEAVEEETATEEAPEAEATEASE